MHVLFSDKKRKGCLKGGWVALCMIIAITCHAQKDDRLPDSVSTSEDNIATPKDGGQTPPKTDTMAPPNADTTTASSTGPASAGQDSTMQQTDTAVLRTVPDSTVYQYQHNKDFEYANDPAYWKAAHPPENPGGYGFWMALARLLSSRVFGIILYTLLGVILLYLLYKIMADNNLHLFYRRARKRNTGVGTEGETPLLEEDLDGKITEALRAGDHRLGVRYLFLKTLRMLDERELIRYQAKATNHEYILQMAPHEKGKDFRFLAGAYEHVWYGDFPLNDQQFEWLNHSFQDFFKTIKSPAS